MTSNVHTHSIWCDGRNTTNEMARAAERLGFSDLGFSSHGPAPFDRFCPGLSDEAPYRAEMAALREEFRGRLNILCGVEQDSMSPVNRAGYDYIIGSVHYLPIESELEAVDGGRGRIEAIIRQGFGGDSMAAVGAFYAQTAASAQHFKPDIVGHFDLITKYNRGNVLFDEDSPAYRRLALESLDAVIDAVASYGGMIEVNASPLYRGLRDVPFPAPFLLKHMAQRGARPIITTDSHQAETLALGFEQALDFLRTAGFCSMAVLRDGCFVDIKI